MQQFSDCGDIKITTTNLEPFSPFVVLPGMVMFKIFRKINNFNSARNEAPPQWLWTIMDLHLTMDF